MDSQKKIDMPYRVPYADTDQMGVVYYANYFVYFERVRNEVLRATGYTYREMEASGIILPVVESHCEHLKPAKYDDELSISGWFEQTGRARIKAHCEVKRGDVLLARGYTVHACLSSETGRPTRVPVDILPTGQSAVGEK